MAVMYLSQYETLHERYMNDIMTKQRFHDVSESAGGRP